MVFSSTDNKEKIIKSKVFSFTKKKMTALRNKSTWKNVSQLHIIADHLYDISAPWHEKLQIKV